MRPAVELHDVRLSRAGRPVLRGVSLAIAPGRVTALLGPSGAGKSTVLRCAVRLEEPDAGTVTVEGSDVRSVDPCALRRRVGLVAQTPVMLPGTVRDNLAYAAENTPEPVLRAALTDAGLEPGAFLERSAGELSGGERARVAIARALVRDPTALLLDEPTAALDPAKSAGIEQLARALAADRGIAVALTTHDVGLARRVADAAYLLSAGRVVAHGPPDEVVAAWEAEPAWR